MSARSFVLLLLATAAAAFALAYAAHTARARNVGNVRILVHQLAKLEDPRLADTQVLIVGDSAAGAAMHAPTFAELSGMPTQSLALTGGFGFIGDYALMQRAKRVWPGLHTVIVMHTLDIWRRRTSPNAFTRIYSPDVDFSLVPGRERGWLERFKVQTNLKEVEWYLKSFWKRSPPLTIAEETGYATQGGKLFATGERVIDRTESLRAAIHPDKVSMLEALDRMGERLGLRVIFVHAPLHEVMVRNSTETIAEINAILGTARTMHALPDVTAYPDAMLGNSTDHVYERRQREATRHYFELVEDHLAGG